MALSLLTVALLAVPLACQEQNGKASLLTDGEAAYRNGDFGRANAMLSEYLGGSVTTADATRALYVRGMARAKAGQPGEAADDLRRCLASQPDADVAWRAHVALGVVNFDDAKWTEAGGAFAAAASRMPRRAPMDVVLYRLAQCYERTGQWAASRTPFQQLVDRFPENRLAEIGRQRLALRPEYFTIRCGAFNEEANARRQVADLRREGHAAEVRREPRDGRHVFAVLVGRYSTYVEAQRALPLVRQKSPEALIWP